MNAPSAALLRALDARVSLVKLLEVAIDAPLAERNAPLRCQIGFDARPLGDPIAQRDQPRHFLLEALHALGKGIAHALDDLAHRQIDVARATADHMGAAVVVQHALEIAQEFRHPVAPEILRAPPRCRALLLEIEPARHRMMGVVDIHDEVGNGELQLMRPQLSGLVARREIQPLPEIEQNIRSLRDDELAGFEKRRRVRRPRAALVLEYLHHRRHAAPARPARDIDVIGAGLFEREADEFAAALDAGPVIKLVAHASPATRLRPCTARRWPASTNTRAWRPA